MSDGEQRFLIEGGGRPSTAHRFWTGTVPSGQQLLIGYGDEALLVLWFDAEGRFSHLERVPVPRSLDSRNKSGSYKELLVEHLREYQRRVGCQPADIRVQPFSITEAFPIALRMMKPDLLEFLCDPYADSRGDEEREMGLGYVGAWLGMGSVELAWDYESYELYQKLDGDPNEDLSLRFIGWPRTSATAGRRYTLRTSGADRGEADFWTGTTPAGEQLLLGPLWEKLLCVRFDRQGKLLGTQTRPVAPPPPQRGRRKRAEPPLSEAEQRAQAVRVALAWQAELGWQPGPIRVEKFLLSDYPVYISDYPPWAIMVHYDPYIYPTPEEREELRQQKAEWEAAGNFVFWWGRDYHVSPEGEVLST